MEYRKNDRVTVTIEDLGTDGEGIGKIDGFTLFIKDAVIGDIVEAKIMKAKKHYAYARLEKVVTPSPFRVEPKCAYHRACGGCQLQALSYEQQLVYKQRKIRNNLVRIGGFDEALIDRIMEPIVGMEHPFRYRNKAQYPIGTDRNGLPIAGFYAGHTHDIIANTDCLLGAEENRPILECILQYMRENHVPAYDEATGTGLIRHVLIRKGFTNGEIMVCVVINAAGASKQHGEEPCEYLPRQQAMIDALTQINGITSISVSINTDRTNVIMGAEIHTLWGSDTISDTIHVRDMAREGAPCTGEELTFRISPLSFYQVNPIQTEKLYSLALAYAGLTGRETVWDLYCGIGTISLFLARSARRVCGVEIIPQAIEDARENARRNGIENAEFFVGKAEEVLPEFYRVNSEHLATGDTDAPDQTAVNIGADTAILYRKDDRRAFLRPDVIVVDPPRKGCDDACLQTMLRMQPDRIVYVSCDSATLARDLKMLHDGGYEITRVRGCDMFGMTGHVECVVLMSRVEK